MFKAFIDYLYFAELKTFKRKFCEETNLEKTKIAESSKLGYRKEIIVNSYDTNSCSS